ncbi:MAG: transcription antitermination factor NusB [Negativicutes bacterium]|jgi:N utilization substance protein B|nr:transcription antitermination factor NusB [Negativicutes bacterium]MBP9536928.1 transcription antitermination factor NusB [Negativicutes bacterium]MBP9949157.1 transcription antitermination factor NusB [Negativicutes bacterium]
MSRRKAREIALQALFQFDFTKNDDENLIEMLIKETKGLNQQSILFTREIIKGTIANLEAIDATIKTVSNDWKIERMAAVDRNIVRMAVYELKFNSEDTAPKIIINEAIEIAKIFGSDESSRFVNGILGALIKKDK